MKRETNLLNHQIDFHDVVDILEGYTSFVDRTDMVKSGIKSSAISTTSKSRLHLRSAAISVGSSQRGAPAETSDENITIVPRGSRRKGKTDWAALDALTDAEIDAAIANDPDWADFKDVDWSKGVVIMPSKKKAISIRVDEDVLAFFKRGGDGYQGRMNAVLRSYMQQTSKPKKRA